METHKDISRFQISYIYAFKLFLILMMMHSSNAFAVSSELLFGTWKIESVQSTKGGVDTTKDFAQGAFKIGAIWILKSDYTGKMGHGDIYRWSFNSED